MCACRVAARFAAGFGEAATQSFKLAWIRSSDGAASDQQAIGSSSPAYNHAGLDDRESDDW
jgi:hypothetical protein